LGFVLNRIDQGRRTLNPREEFNIEEKQILDLLDRGLSHEFPNPQRSGCPGHEILRKVAEHRLRLSEAHPWLNHLGSCSPCFLEFKEIREQVVSKRRPAAMWLAVASVALLAVGGWLWIRNRPSGQTPAVIVLDLRARAPVRGETTDDTHQPPLEIPSGTRLIQLDLPVGSNEGIYNLTLLDENGVELLHSTGTAQLEDHTVNLRVEVDLARVSPGWYMLGLRRPGMEWTRFPVRLL
jgi:hypothetical protein